MRSPKTGDVVTYFYRSHSLQDDGTVRGLEAEVTRVHDEQLVDLMVRNRDQVILEMHQIDYVAADAPADRRVGRWTWGLAQHDERD